MKLPVQLWINTQPLGFGGVKTFNTWYWLGFETSGGYQFSKAQLTVLYHYLGIWVQR